MGEPPSPNPDAGKIHYGNRRDFALTPLRVTTRHIERYREHRESKSALQLIYPKRLLAEQRHLANRYLGMIPPQARQVVLDELEGRLRAEQRGARLVYNAVRFLGRLCEAVQDGTFEPNLGIAVRIARERTDHERFIRPPKHAEPSDRAVQQKAA